MSCDRPEPLRSENAAGWLQNIRMLADLQDQIIKCRRFASETSNPEQSRRLYQIANDIEQRARELDREYCSGRRGGMVQGGRQETGAALGGGS
jgi:hypothetical protein